ncbi:MAG: ATP-dependent helicase [Candidatus Levybacteria bacterium]|nr:ATP-dependent helicase [Candidatus Levybacteria bacterium]
MKAGINLDKNQLKAVNFDGGPLLIIAGAGTGKTTVITERIKHLVLNKKVSPSQILALTFTEKAAFEMEERVDTAMPYGYTQMWISTFHSFCDRILRSESIHIGLNPAYRLMTEAESILFLRQNLFKLKLNYFRPLGNPNKFLEAILQHFSRLKDEDISPDQYLKFVKTNKEIKKNKDEYKKYIELSLAFKTYEALKEKEGVMDFSDLISNTLKLFRQRPNILKQYQEMFKYILVDEFQDTNFAQNELAILLAGKKQNITVVGDDDQSIYRFRGSSISNILQFKKRFPKAKIVTLTRNYRSTKQILDKSYSLIQYNNPDRLEVREKINKKLVSVRNIEGEEIKLIYKRRVEDEAEEVANKIQQLVSGKKYDYKDFAILVRANDHADSFVRALQRAKIPYQFLGPGRLFHQEEIKDLISYLKVLYNFEDTLNLYRVLNMEVFDLEAIEIVSLLNFSKRKNFSLFEALENVDQLVLKQKGKEKIKKLVKMIKRHLKLIPKNTAGQILYYFLEESNLIKRILEYKTLKEELIAKNIAKFFDKLKTYETEHKTASVYEVVDWIDLSMQMGESPLSSDTDWSENNAVNILTVHSAKGLEFSVVFLVNLVSQRFPTRERREKIPIPEKLIKEILPIGDYHLEEERRLFYVGMTRAKDYLFLTAASFYGEGKQNRKLSPFVYESLGEKEVEKILNKEIKIKETQLSLIEWGQKELAQEKASTKAIPINYISYSHIQTFDICPLHYKLKFILKIPTIPTAPQSFGTSIHLVLRDFYQSWINKEDLNINMKNIAKLFKLEWKDEGYSSREHEKRALNKAKQIVFKYLKNNFDKNNLPLALEIPFVFNIGELKVGGRIDRIDKLKNEKIEIIDYKTGQNVLTDKDLIDNKQLSLYGLAAREVLEKPFNINPDNLVLSLHFLETNTKVSTQRDDIQLGKIREYVLEKKDQISKSNFECSKSIYCKNCEYKMLCASYF